MRKIKESVRKLDTYSVPQDFSLIKLNQNESAIDIPLEMKKKIFKKLGKINWNRYPSATADSLIERISNYTGFPSSGILVGNGSNELIQALIYSVCDSEDRILVVQPSFSIYKIVASVMNIDLVEVPLRDDFGFAVDAIIENGKESKLMILASPNNPTGTALKIREIEQIAREFDGLMTVDEAYYEFHQETAQELIHKLDNIIVLRTLSKGFRLAGIRLGYLMGSKEVVKELIKAKLPFSLGVFQQVAGEVILENRKFIQSSVETIIRERSRLFEELKCIRGIHPIPSCANFVLFESKIMSGKELYRILFKKGVLVRYFDVPGLKNMLRVTVGTPEENDLFVKKLKQIAEGNL